MRLAERGATEAEVIESVRKGSGFPPNSAGQDFAATFLSIAFGAGVNTRSSR